MHNIYFMNICFCLLFSVIITKGCTHISIHHCTPGRQECGYSPSGDNIRCTHCERPYYAHGTHKSLRRVKRSACSATCGGGTREVYVAPAHSSSCSGGCFCGGYCGGNGRKRRSYRTESCGQTCFNGYPYSSGKCQCPDWRRDKCCQGCTHINIHHCIPGRQDCGYSPSGDNIKCTLCEKPYFSQGWGASSCHECPRITNCAMRHCSSPADVVCERCMHDKIFYKVQAAGKHCERMCAWNNHYCWPGTCGNELTTNCKCASDFKRVDSPTETSCQPSTPPTILQCDTIVTGTDRTRTIPGICHELEDFYGMFQPKTFQYRLTSDFDIDISSFAKPAFIKESNFGISDATVRIIKETVNGTTSTLSEHKILEDITRSTKVVQPAYANGIVDVSALKYYLQNGQRLCIKYEIKAGGYLKHIDLSSSSHIVSNAIPYQKTSAMRKLCYRYDDKSPEHCSEKTTCTSEPLGIHQDDITTRSAIISITLNGWKDPIPLNGNKEHASGIESYIITVHEVDSTSYIQKVAGKLQEIELNNTDNSVTLNLTSDRPKLYCINLEVKDVADNVRHARRFVLYDNTSFIETRYDESFKVTSTSVQTSYKWQTHHNDTCLSWKDHFYNKVYLKPNFLNAIETDPSDPAIQGVYDQTSGMLPVSGTTNVDGIIGFYFSSSLNHGQYKPEEAVPNFENQTFCKQIDVTDGQTYTLNIKAVDVMNNTYSDYRTIHIDRSLPHIDNVWLIKDGYKRLFVHDRTDLSTMQLYFETLDPHSGIQKIEWIFGITDTGAELARGSIGVNAIVNGTCSTDVEKCYCPNVGACELFNYTVPLNTLKVNNKDKGAHNRTYFFRLKTTNNALLSNTEMVNILVDYSPPEQGAVLEGCLPIFILGRSEYVPDPPLSTTILSHHILQSTNTAAIAGGTVGGILVVVIVLLAIVIVRRKENPGIWIMFKKKPTKDDHVYYNTAHTRNEVIEDSLRTERRRRPSVIEFSSSTDDINTYEHMYEHVIATNPEENVYSELKHDGTICEDLDDQTD